jgi:hypothetical protein
VRWSGRSRCLSLGLAALALVPALAALAVRFGGFPVFDLRWWLRVARFWLRARWRLLPRWARRSLLWLAGLAWSAAVAALGLLALWGLSLWLA